MGALLGTIRPMDVDTIDRVGLTAGKVCLRAKTAADVAPGYRLIQQHGALLSGQSGVEPPLASRLTEDQLAQLWTPWKRSAPEGGQYQLAITDAESGDFRGSLVVRSTGPGQLADLGYWVDPEFWGHGFGSGGVHLALRWVFGCLDASGATASVQPDNSRSRRLLQGLDFEELGLVPGQTPPLIACHLPRHRWQARGGDCSSDAP